MILVPLEIQLYKTKEYGIVMYQTKVFLVFFLTFCMCLAQSNTQNEDLKKMFFKNQPSLAQLAEALKSSDLGTAKSLMKNGLDINALIEIPNDIDLEKYEFKNKSIGWTDRLIDGTFGAIWDMATSKKKSKLKINCNTTLLNVLVVLDEYDAIAGALKLGADPLIVTTWNHDAIEAALSLRKSRALDLFLQSYHFNTLPISRQHAVIKRLPKIDINGNALFGYECVLDTSLLEVGIKHKIDFDMTLVSENSMKQKVSSTLLKESLKDSSDLLTVEWLLLNNFGKAISSDEILRGLREINLKHATCRNAETIVKRIELLIANRQI